MSPPSTISQSYLEIWPVTHRAIPTKVVEFTASLPLQKMSVVTVFVLFVDAAQTEVSGL